MSSSKITSFFNEKLKKDGLDINLHRATFCRNLKRNMDDQEKLKKLFI